MVTKKKVRKGGGIKKLGKGEVKINMKIFRKEIEMNKIAVEQTYMDVENLIRKTVWKFQKKYGGEFDELFAQANLIYMLAYNDYERGRSQFTTWLHFRIIKGLQQQLRENYKTPRINDEVTNLEEIAVFYPKKSMNLLEDLFKDDVKNLIEMAIKAYNEHGKLQSKRSVSYYIRKHLQKDLGWTVSQVNKKLKKIKKIVLDNL